MSCVSYETFAFDIFFVDTAIHYTVKNLELDHIDNRLQLSIAKLVTWFRGQIRGREYLARRLETLVPVLRSVPRIAGVR